MTKLEKLAALRYYGYRVIRSGSLGVSIEQPPFYLPWAKVGPFLGHRARQAKRSLPMAARLAWLAERTPEPWEKRRKQYLEEVQRSEKPSASA